MQTETDKVRALDRFPSAVYRNGVERRVKNLGWLIRNWKLVKHFTIRTTLGDVRLTPNGVETVPVKLDGTLLIAWLDDGIAHHYSSGFAGDIEHVKQWLDRPVFRGLPVRIDPESKDFQGASKHPGATADYII